MLEVKSFGRERDVEFLVGVRWGDVFVRKMMKKRNKKTFVDLCVSCFVKMVFAFLVVVVPMRRTKIATDTSHS